MSGADTVSGNDTINEWLDEEPTQQLTRITPNEADTVCNAWMQRGRELAARRDQVPAREAA